MPNEIILEDDYNKKKIEGESREYGAQYFEDLNLRRKGGLQAGKREEKEWITIYEF